MFLKLCRTRPITITNSRDNFFYSSSLTTLHCYHIFSIALLYITSHPPLFFFCFSHSYFRLFGLVIIRGQLLPAAPQFQPAPPHFVKIIILYRFKMISELAVLEFFTTYFLEFGKYILENIFHNRIIKRRNLE